MGTNRRYGDAIARQKDNARAEARALVASSLPIDLVTTAGGPVVTARQPVPVQAYVEVGVTLIRVDAFATAWNRRCVHIRWAGTNPTVQQAWVWASAVARVPTS